MLRFRRETSVMMVVALAALSVFAKPTRSMLAAHRTWAAHTCLYDAEVEWIDSSNSGKPYGAEWIDTGIIPNERTSARFLLATNYGSGNVILGYREASDYRDWRFLGTLGTYMDVWSGRANGSEVKITWPTMTEYEVGNLFARNVTAGTGYSGTPIAAFTGDRSITLNGHVNQASCRWGWVKIMEGDAIVWDAIPVRFTNEYGTSEGAMFDRVSGQLFRNQGTGAFVIGPDKK